MTTINIDSILAATTTLNNRITSIEGKHHGSAWIFDQCMRAFDSKLPAEAITFTVFYNAPVMRAGLATIHRDGTLTCTLGEA